MAAMAAIVEAKRRIEHQHELDSARDAWSLTRSDTLHRDLEVQVAKLGGRPLPTVGIHRGEEEDQKDIADGESEEDSEAPLPEGLPMIEFILPYQRWFYVFYNSTPIQLITAALIFSNFIINAAEAQYCGSNSSCFVDEDGFKGALNERYPSNAVWKANETATFLPLTGSDDPKDWYDTNPGVAVFLGFEYFFTFIFLLELIINYWGHHWKPFISSGWNWFDTVVVTVSLVSVAVPGLPGVSTLRLMRAFRVFRLFKRLESLKKIMSCLANAIPGCMSAFFIVILITSIYAILGVEFFSTLDTVIHPGNGHPHGPYYFGDFGSAMFTMFQVMTGESWAEMVARPLVDAYPLSALYFISYILVVGLVLINVVVAVLLEKMGGVDDEEPSDEDEKDTPELLHRKYLSWVMTQQTSALAERLEAQDKKIDALTQMLARLEAKL